MTFSLRTFLIVVAALGIWLGALFSGVPLLLELVGYASSLFILLTLPLAIWESRPSRRAFWTGFFVLAVGSYLLSHYFHTLDQTTNQITTLIVPGQANAGWTSYPPLSLNPYGPSVSISAPTLVPSNPANGYPGASSLPYSAFGNTYEQYSVVRFAVPIFLSLLAGGVGGAVTLWISRPKNSEQEKLTS